MRRFLDAFGLVGSGGQSPITFPCSFDLSNRATRSLLQDDDEGLTSAPDTPDLLAASDSGSSDADNITSIVTPTFRVGLPAEAIETDTLRVYSTVSGEIASKALDGTDIANGYADVTAGSSLSAGGHTITARVENAGGLSPASGGLAVTVDVAAPDAPADIIVTPADQGDHSRQTDNTQPTFRITLALAGGGAAVAGDVVTLEIDTVDDAAATLTGTDIANGYVDIQSANVLADDTSYDISAYITDVAGNEGASSAAVAVEVGDAIDEIPAVVYAGGPGFLVVEAATHGAADGTQVHGGAYLRFRSDGSVMYLRASGGSQPFHVRRNADNTLEFASAGVFSCVTAAVPASTGWMQINWSANGTAAQLTVQHAGGLISGVNTPGSAADLSLAQDWHYGEDAAGGNRLHADVAMWWEKAGQSIDLSDSDVREQWYDTTAHILRQPGPTGTNPVDAAYTPDFFVATWSAAHGVGADSAGVFADGISPGVWAADYNPIALEFAVTANPAIDGANSGSTTWSSQPIGDPAPGRVLYAAFVCRANLGVAPIVSTVTCRSDGATDDAMNLRVSLIHKGTTSAEAIVIIATLPQTAMSNPSATTANFTITFSGQVRGKKLTVFRGVGYSDAPTDTGTSVDTNPDTDTITFADNGIVLAGAVDFSNQQCTWSSPLTEQFDATMLFGNERGTIAYASGTATGATAVTATFDAFGGNPSAMGCASFPVA